MSVTAILGLCLVAGAAVSDPGRAVLKRLFSSSSGETSAVTPGDAIEEAGQDVEQRARARHGWNAAVINSVMRGQITFYNREGESVDQANMTLFRLYSDRMRMELKRGRKVETLGFNQARAWKVGAASVGEAEGRDIRAWMRLWPERLFVARDKGAGYREAGRRIENFRPARPGQDSAKIEPPKVSEQVVIEDSIGSSPPQGETADRRFVTYYVDRDTQLVEAARWLEPDDPRRSIDDPETPRVDVRVDFADWRDVNGVWLPFEVTRWTGGKIALRIQLSEVQLNQPLSNSLFSPATNTR